MLNNQDHSGVRLTLFTNLYTIDSKLFGGDRRSQCRYLNIFFLYIYNQFLCVNALEFKDMLFFI